MATQNKMKIRIFDTTLRDGEQGPDVRFDTHGKIAVAKALDKIGVDAIEVGCLAQNSSNGERDAVARIAALKLNAEIYVLARARRDDIDEIAKIPSVKCVHTYIATSELHRQVKFRGATFDAVIGMAADTVSYAKSKGLKVLFSAEDATNTDIKSLKAIYAAVQRAGADEINIPDTLGKAWPEKMADITKAVASVVSIPIHVHCHNDFDGSVANTIAAIKAGADCAQVTVLGIGERVGNAALERVVATLHFREDLRGIYETNVRPEMLNWIARIVSKESGVAIPHRSPVVGAYVGVHTAGIHSHAVMSNPQTYEAIPLESVGAKRDFVIGKLTGRHAIDGVLKAKGILADRDQIVQILRKVKDKADGEGTISVLELYKIADAVMKHDDTSS
jgi:2-isopropylmalate synthase